MLFEKTKVALCLALAVAGCAAPEQPNVGGGKPDLGQGGSHDLGATPPEDLSGMIETPDLAVAPPDLAPPPDLTPPCVDSGNSCTTGNPGACAAGHAVCVNSVLTCVPDVTTQPCYDGTPGTAGHGVCKTGTQSCIGALGACNGQVVNTALENCFNDTDDDCNDVVNNGCPDTVSLGSSRALGSVGGAGGGAVSARCPANAWVTRAQFLFDDTDKHGTGVRIFCSTPTLVRGASSYSITLTQVAPAPYTSFQGGTYTPPDEQTDCGTGTFVAGWGTGGYAGTYVDGFGMSCANGTITMAANNTLSYSFAKNGVGIPYVSYTTSTKFEELCAADEVIVGWDGRTGSWQDQLTPICAPLVTSYK